MHRWGSEDSPAPGRQERGGRTAGGPASTGRPPVRWRFPWELCLLLSAIAVLAFTAVGRAPDGPPQPAGPHANGTVEQGARSEPPADPLPASRPLSVSVPAIHVDGPLMDLALQDDGRLAAPPENDRNLAGWWAGGPTPGAKGTAIIAGHVDIPSGPAVFYNLGALKPGMTIDVARADQRTAHFTIDTIDVYDADNFPDDKVYGDTGRPELRLITCGGGFDKQLQRYQGNVVVTAHLTQG
ncbi:class F sortase [Streptomyces sp. SID8379]|uniref:class F sortase n=1 Tax=unclassified Streptomyces TaxID=2593676 RepID=UPI000376DA35|nr:MULTISPECIES: class F sortase [unclassified Streptomyces]MYW62575.1 class F sortase [Streptomyces sp. SID8379]